MVAVVVGVESVVPMLVRAKLGFPVARLGLGCRVGFVVLGVLVRVVLERLAIVVDSMSWWWPIVLGDRVELVAVPTYDEL